MASHGRNLPDESEDEEDFHPSLADAFDGAESDPRTKTNQSLPDRDPDDDEDVEIPVQTRPSHERLPTGHSTSKFADNQPDVRSGAREPNEEQEDDEEELEEDDEALPQNHRRKRRRDGGNMFIEYEAEVDDEDEGEEDERDGEEEDFIDNDPEADELVESGALDDDRRHRDLDRRRELDAHMDAEKQAELLKKKYGHRRPGRGLGSSSVVPRRLLLPSVDDPGIWAVKCKEGKERDVVFSIMKRVEEHLGSKKEMKITAAFERGGTHSVMRGFIYVEAVRQSDVLASLDGLLNVYPRTKMILVEIKDMPELFRISKTPTLEPGTWVRLKRPPKYAGDLAQVLDVTENGLEARIRFIPRIEYVSRDSFLKPADGKRKRPTGAAGIRPQARLFSEVEARKHHYVVGNEVFENGFQIKDVKIQQLTITDVNPTLEDVSKFTSGAEDGTENLDLKAIAASLKDNSLAIAYLPGDVVEVYSGEQKGVVGKTTNNQGGIITIQVIEGDLTGQTIDVPTKGLRKRFNLGDHVKVIGGSQFRDEVGMVVDITDDRVTLLTDHTKQEITVFSKDLREASDSGGQASLGLFSLLDLVQLDPVTVGCVVRVERESFMVLDQNGDIRPAMPSQISNRLPVRKNAVAADGSGSEIRIDDVVREHGGQHRQGKIIHIHRLFIFCHTNDTNENSGVFVTKASNVNTIAAKGGRISTTASGPDLSIMNPALKLHKSNDVMNMPPPKVFGRDRALGHTVVIKKGVYKGLLGIVKDTTDTHARIELHTKGKTVNVAKELLIFKDKVTGQTIDINGRGRPPPSGSFGVSRGSVPVTDWRSGARTPIVASSGLSDRTPAWASPHDGGRTPAWRSQEPIVRTPAWGADGSRTVNPYDGSRTAYGSGARTPAWQSGAKTPVADGFGSGSKTPAWYGGAGSDPWSLGSKTPGYSAPTPGASGNDSWGYTPGALGGAYDASTPGIGLLGARTPGALNAPTPGDFSVATPAALGAPTPGVGYGGWSLESAPTPAVAASTPGASGFAGSGYYGAPTPAAYGAAPETPAGSGPRYVEDD